MNQFDKNKYRTLIFDCDGVLLDSNQVKTDAFFDTGHCYGEEAAMRLVEYHRKNGGVSRYRKFEYFLREIVGVVADEAALQELLNNFAQEVLKGLMTCPVSTALPSLLQLDPEIHRLVVSGGDQNELRKVFCKRSIDTIFDGGIFGSPDDKETILKRELESGNIRQPALFFGDSRYDHEVASNFGIDFIFVSGWTEFTEWREYQERHGFPVVTSLGQWISIT
jgi:phosphoglycolate phosphatase-like HAD superfamily hydrolase